MIDKPALSAVEIEAFRRAMGLTAEELSRKITVHARTIRAWEAGKQRISPIYAAAIARLWEEHTAQAQRLAEEGNPVMVARDDPERGWKLAVFARAHQLNSELRAGLENIPGNISEKR